MGNITIQGDITATVPGNAVGGASALTTPGSVPFVTAAGVLGQSANLFWDNANGRLGVGTNAPAAPLDVRSSSTSGILSIRSTSASGFSSIDLLTNAGNLAGSVGYANASAVALASSFYIGSRIAGENTVFLAGGSTARVTINGTSGNLLIGTTTDGNFKLDVASSGSSGTLRAWDQTPTTGSTSLVVRAGAGQSGNLFSVRNASNVEQFWVNAFGPEANSYIAVARFRTNSNEVGIEATSGLDLASNRLIRYSSTTDYSATKDLSLSRASANTLQVGDGSANSNGTVLARRVQSAGETVANLPAAAAGNAGTITYITDANATTIGSTVAGGGSNKVLVWSDGTAWKIFAS